MQRVPHLTHTESQILKLILLGDGGVGKTAMMQRFVHNTFQDQGLFHTIGVEFLKKEIMIPGFDRCKFVLQIWDTAGQERYRSLRTPFFRGTDICILSFAVDDMASFRNLDTWKQEFLTYADLPEHFTATSSNNNFTENNINNNNNNNRSDEDDFVVDVQNSPPVCNSEFPFVLFACKADLRFSSNCDGSGDDDDVVDNNDNVTSSPNNTTDKKASSKFVSTEQALAWCHAQFPSYQNNHNKQNNKRQSSGAGGGGIASDAASVSSLYSSPPFVYVETSAKTNTNVPEAFEQAVKLWINSPLNTSGQATTNFSTSGHSRDQNGENVRIRLNNSQNQRGATNQSNQSLKQRVKNATREKCC